MSDPLPLLDILRSKTLKFKLYKLLVKKWLSCKGLGILNKPLNQSYFCL